MSLGGVKAPKDPLKKSKGFYVYKDLKIEATERGDGRRTREIYLDCGRLKNAVEIVAGITDETILNNFDTAQGLKDMVTGIGVSITADADNAVMKFGVLMYGKEDMYNGGTHIYQEVLTGGVETMIPFEGVQWSEDDALLGQFEIEFPEGLTYADLTVRIYVHDTYDVPKEQEDVEVDTDSPAYQKMIERAVLSVGNNERFLRAVRKAQAKEDVTIAFIGGSITQGAGAVPIATECYAYKTYRGFVERFGGGTEEHIHYVKAGIGGTSSELGVVRYEKDVCSFGEIKPDLVIMEFAVNDEGDETKGDCYEGLMRKIWNSPNEPALILMFSVFSYDWNLQERFIPMGEAFGIPMVSVKDAVTPQFAEAERVVSKRQFFYDMYHPTNIGHTIMADGICHYFDLAAEKELTSDIVNPPIVKSADFEKVTYFDRKRVCPAAKITEGSFRETDVDIQSVERNLDDYLTPMFPNNWMCDGTKDSSEPFVCQIRCKLLLMVMQDSGSNEFGKAKVVVDGKEVMIYDPKEVGWTHSNAVVVIREDEAADHVVEVSMAQGDEKKKFTILAMGYVGE